MADKRTGKKPNPATKAERESLLYHEEQMSNADKRYRQAALKAAIDFYLKHTSLTKRDVTQVCHELAPAPRIVLQGGSSGKKNKSGSRKKGESPEIAALKAQYPEDKRGPDSEYAKAVREIRGRQKTKTDGPDRSKSKESRSASKDPKKGK